MSFNTNGGIPSEISPLTLDSGTVAWEGFPSDPVKEGYTFDGWLDETSEIVYTKSTTITKNVTLTAKWTIIESGKATVSFYTDGGIPATIEPVTLDSGETLGAKFPADPERAGYTFGGWFDTEETPYEATTPITKNVAITAKWIIKTYTISFSRNGGTSAAISPVVVDSGSVFSANMPANPTRPGFDFVGWFDSGDNEYTAQSIITGNLSLLAKWAEAGSLSSSGVVGSSSSVSAGSSSGNASSSSARSSSSLSAVPPVSTPKNNYTETVNGVSFDMIYVPGGTFTLGCEKNSGCPEDAKPVTGVKVSPYFIGKTEVTLGLWNAVMDTTCSGYMCQTSSSYTSMTWYDAMRFACRLSNKTGRKYHMSTEAEWEYAAKNHVSSLQKINSGNEWAYNTWNGTHTGGTDPIGPITRVDGKVTWGHSQKTRRDATETVDHITGRLIRSIEGVGPALRLVVSSDMDYPPNMVPPCDIHAPEMGGEPANSYRDPRWVTGSDKRWTATGDIKIGNFDLRVWDDGTATMTTAGYNGYGGGTTNGQWFTSNNVTLVFVPSSGSVRRFFYIFLDEINGSLITDKGYTDGYIGRIVKESASNATKPTVSGLKSGEELAKAQSDFSTYYQMVDMTNIPAAAKKQDSRLLDGTTQGWFQNNTQAGGQHHYRKDIDLDEFRFTVNQLTGANAGSTMLANGNWFTVNNTFLRVTHSTGYVVEYLYAVDSDGTFYHNSFMAYERGDFRMFKKTANSSSFPCGNLCNSEIPKGQAASMYAPGGFMSNVGHSTFVPAPCPSGGCK
jgi:uncharacterized repeat protein (TIGR02543 family)